MTSWRKFVIGILLAFVAFPAFARHPEFRYEPAEYSKQLSVEKTGTIPTKPGQSLRLNTDPGNVRIFTDESRRVSYRVIVEIDPRGTGAAELLNQFTFSAQRIPAGVSLQAQLPWRTFQGRFSVTLEVHVPRHYNLKINTQGGSIEVQDINGQVELISGGGNIAVGRVEGPNRAGTITAQIETQGGHITAGDIAGTLRATTSGGHISTGNIGGDGVLRTGGGQIQTGRIMGTAALETGGGNIRVARSGLSAALNTTGGEIELGEAAGAIRAQTGGGAIHIGHVTGQAVVETDGGGIFLGQMDAPVRVSSGDGNMIVYLPRRTAATIDAVIEHGDGHSIVADPSLPLRIDYRESASGSSTIHGEGDLNGGGEKLHLKTTSGNIILRMSDPRGGWNGALQAGWMPAAAGSPAMQAWNSDEDAEGLFEEVRRKILESWWGGVPVDAAEMQNHLEHSVAPAYPDVARSAGVEGDVVLRVYVSGDGHVSDIRVLDGPPILARAAVEAVQQWRYQAPLINGQPTNVVTTLIVAFRLK